MRKRTIFIFTLLVLALTAPPVLARTTVRVDRSFGDGGMVEGRFGPHYERTAFTSVASQPDGTILAALGRPPETTASLRRYAANGTLDPGFPATQASRQPEAIQEDGKVLKAVEGALQRFNPDGSWDLTFGTRPSGLGKLSDDTGFTIEQIEPLPSGGILVGGSIVVYVPESSQAPARSYVEQVAVARFDGEGRLDPGFGAAGVVRLRGAVGLAGERLLGLAPRPGGGVVAIVLDSLPHQFGEAVSHSGSTIVGLAVDGRLDPSFGSAGMVRLADAAALAFQALPGGELLVAGDRWGTRVAAPRAAHASDVFLNRYTAAGQSDPGFGGGDGSVVVDLARIDLLGAMLVHEDGSIFLGGSATETGSANCRRFYDQCRETPFVLRFTPQGAFAPEFGGGVLALEALSWPYGPFEGGVGVLALAPRPGGGVLAAGGSGTTAFIAALSSTGALDPGFGSGGIVRESESRPSSTSADALEVDSRGRILVAGATGADIHGNAPLGALFRYLPGGELDRAFGGGRGYVRLPDWGKRIAVGAGDAAFVLSVGLMPSVTRVLASGQVDGSYGEEGTAELPATVAVRRDGRVFRRRVDPVSVAALSRGRLLVAGTAASSESRMFVMRLRADGELDRSFGGDGIILLSCGRSPRCSARQMAVQGGRIVLAGYLEGPRGRSRGEALAVMRLRADGARDRSFGRRGLVVTRIGRRSAATAVAVERSGRILVAGKATVGKQTRELLLRYRADGRLDRAFGPGGVVSRGVPFAPGGFFSAARRILLQPDRILVLRSARREQLVVYSRDGRRRRAFAVARGALPNNRSSHAPLGALQGRKLILGWNTYDVPHDSFKVERLRIGGRP